MHHTESCRVQVSRSKDMRGAHARGQRRASLDVRRCRPAHFRTDDLGTLHHGPVERAAHLSHFTRDALHRTRADTALPSNSQHTLAGPQMALDSSFSSNAKPFPRFLGPLKPGADSFVRSFCARTRRKPGNLKHQPSGRCGGVNGLLVEVEVPHYPMPLRVPFCRTGLARRGLTPIGRVPRVAARKDSPAGRRECLSRICHQKFRHRRSRRPARRGHGPCRGW